MISAAPVGHAKEVKPVPLKAATPMEVTESRPVIDVRPEQPLKVTAEISRAPVGHAKEVIPVPLKALTPMEVTESRPLIAVTSSQFVKAYSGIEVWPLTS